MSNIVKQKFKIDGMHCSSCAMTIDFDLEDLAGVKKAQTSYAAQQTVIEFDADVLEVEDLIGQIAKTGYKALVEISD